MKTLILILLWISAASTSLYAQEKRSTLDRALETTSGILNILDKHNNNHQSKENSEELITGKLSIINSTGKRLTIILKSKSQSFTYDKVIVLGIDDNESIIDLKLGGYAYVAKFEDGIIAKSGDIEFTKEHPSFEKVVK